MRFFVPELTINEALNFKQTLPETISDKDFIFDFSRMTNFDPTPMLVVGSMIRAYAKNNSNVQFYVDCLNCGGKDYAGVMGFFKYISPMIPLGKMPGEAIGNTNYIPITPIIVNDLIKAESDKGVHLHIGSVIEKESGRLAKIIARDNFELHKLLTYLIREILRNTPEHSETDKMWICGQYWPSHDLAEISIIDEGIGVFKSLSKNPIHRTYIHNNAEALRWSLEPGISESFSPSMKQTGSDEWANSGYGLYMASEICGCLDGSFNIISNENYLKTKFNRREGGSTSFQGTAISMRVKPTRIKSANGIISQIATQGEVDAKLIRNAFQKASTPSRELLDWLH